MVAPSEGKSWKVRGCKEWRRTVEPLLINAWRESNSCIQPRIPKKYPKYWTLHPGQLQSTARSNFARLLLKNRIIQRLSHLNSGCTINVSWKHLKGLVFKCPASGSFEVITGKRRFPFQIKKKSQTGPLHTHQKQYCFAGAEHFVFSYPQGTIY